MKFLARKRMETPSGGNAPWMNTFADLMNLLLCFFVMLFAMSDVDGEKFKDISISLSNSFGIFDNGGTSIGEGQLISAGADQLNDLGEYYSNMGENSKKTGNDDVKENNDSEKNKSVESDKETKSDSKYNSDQTENQSDTDKLSEAMKELQKHKIKASEDMYNNVSELSDQYNLGDYMKLNIDSDYQYVQLTLMGSVLFDSGRAEIKEKSKPVLSKLGDVLKKYDDCTIEIEGHTDSVPITRNKTYKDNNWLSSARALNAAEYFIKEKHMDPEKIKYSGRGEYEPVADNATAEGRAKNRRIVIKIYNKYSGR